MVNVPLTYISEGFGMINTILNGDCHQLLKNIDTGSIKMILADFPYGKTKCPWDSVLDLNIIWKEFNRILKQDGVVILTAQFPYDKVLAMSNIGDFKYEWIWEKSQATGHFNAKKMPMKAHETVLVFYKGSPTYNPQKTQGHKPVNTYTKRKEMADKCEIYNKNIKDVSGGGNTDRYPRSVLKFPSDKQKSSLHPTQKPLALFEYLIKTYTNEGDLVLDNCAGSFTTAVACDNLKRNWICMEKELEYCQSGFYRINENREKLGLPLLTSIVRAECA